MAQRPQITKTQLLAERFKDLVANGRTAKSGTREALIEDAPQGRTGKPLHRSQDGGIECLSQSTNLPAFRPTCLPTS